jgi:DNA polymerase-3 subunit epsilon
MQNGPLSWTQLPLVGFDLETTGRDPRTALIVSAALIIVNGSGEVLQSRTWLVNPGVEIPQKAIDVHGITNEKARTEGLPAAEAIAQISQALDEVFEADIPAVAFNGAYDFTVLAYERERHSIAGRAPKPVIDPFILQKEVDTYRKGKKTLTALCEAYGVDLMNAHDAAADALAAVQLSRALGAKFPVLATDAVRLHDQQVGWARAQAKNFQEYKRRTDPAAVIEGGWPVYDGSPA